jgi:protein TonB
MTLALGLSLGLHAAVFTGLKLLPTHPTVPGAADHPPATLTLVEIGEENPPASEGFRSKTPNETHPSPIEPLLAPEPALHEAPTPVEPIPEQVVEAPAPLDDQSAGQESAGNDSEAAPTPTPDAGPAVTPLQPSITTAVATADAALRIGSAQTTAPVAATADALPTYRFNPKPAYPAMARRHHQEGLVVLHVVVTPEGRPASVRVSQSSGYPLLDDAAQSAVCRWRFTPGRVGWRAVTRDVQVPIQFNLVEH